MKRERFFLTTYYGNGATKTQWFFDKEETRGAFSKAMSAGPDKVNGAPVGAKAADQFGDAFMIWGDVSDDESEAQIDAWGALEKACGLSHVAISHPKLRTEADLDALVAPGKATVKAGYFPDATDVGRETGTTVRDVLLALDKVIEEIGPVDHRFFERFTTTHVPGKGHIVNVFMGS
ncbi:hypothetical protein RPALISO_158 [Ruegeria phage RpAliso]|nr:hypothetical protein RPALISO_158 [Ruegeria phage RpAliso]